MLFGRNRTEGDASHTDGREKAVLRKSQEQPAAQNPSHPPLLFTSSGREISAAQPCSSLPSHAAAQPSWEIPTTEHHSANCNSS
ncbi:hypothetical protein SLEP1_g46529 [Rubroshorea leprosula]|uniref:Uncharacterized protein n=1 Tax=Rubroshorea leprosula TaxID=152421 RepID=A0AAV5LNF5_9ROSI|nr:hypothetical protein SLEP1_g46529 [Rubroshorea leprosula]